MPIGYENKSISGLPRAKVPVPCLKQALQSVQGAVYSWTQVPLIFQSESRLLDLGEPMWKPVRQLEFDFFLSKNGKKMEGLKFITWHIL